MHEKKSFWEKLVYRYDLIGTVERDGQVFKKYKKVHRYPWVRNLAVVFMYICLLAGVFAFVNFFWNLTQPKRNVTIQETMVYEVGRHSA